MFCRKCGAEIQDDSLFCPKCGCKVEITNDVKLDDSQNNYENDPLDEEIQNITDDKPADEEKITEKFISKMRLSKKIAIALGIVIICTIGYSIYYQNTFSNAKKLYDNEEYYDAGSKLDGLINFTGDQEFETIKFSKEIGSEYSFYKKEMSYDEKFRNYSTAASDLFTGLIDCKDAEKKYTDSLRVSLIGNFKNKYYLELNSQFNISQSDADRISSLNYQQIQDEANSIEKNKLADEQQQEYKSENPLSFSDLSWDSNDLYTIATGSAKNISDKIVKFANIKISFMDDSGNVIDTASTYAVGEEGLNPGESCKWTASVTRDSKITKYQVSLINYE